MYTQIHCIEQIKQSVEEFVKREFINRENVFYILLKCRELFEIDTSLRDAYPYIYIYSNWSAHYRIGGAGTMWKFLCDFQNEIQTNYKDDEKFLETCMRYFSSANLVKDLQGLFAQFDTLGSLKIPEDFWRVVKIYAYVLVLEKEFYMPIEGQGAKKSETDHFMKISFIKFQKGAKKISGYELDLVMRFDTSSEYPGGLKISTVIRE